MRLRLLATAVTLMMLSACAGRPPGPPPPPPAALLAPVASAASVAIWQNSLSEANRRLEADAIAQYPDLAVRAGTTLYIFRNGNVLTQRESDPQNCAGFATCTVWFFNGALSLASEQGREVFARLTHTDGVGFTYVLINGRGSDVPLGGGTGLPSPDGRTIASGADQTDERDDTNRLMVIDWAGNIPPVVFGPSCEPLKWLDNQSFEARCVVADESYAFNGVARRGPAGLWTLSETARYHPRTLSPVRTDAPLKVWQGEVLPPPL